MNRRQQRAAKKQNRNVTFIDYGHLSERDRNFGLSVACYVCGTQHKALGLARITHDNAATDVPLCERCLASDSEANAVYRKFFNAPDCEVTDITTEQLMALAEKPDVTH
jgi:hypothetical protein